MSMSPSIRIRRLARRGLGALLAAAALAAPRAGAETEAPRGALSLDRPVEFIHGTVFHPVAPFELVPGRKADDWAFVFEPYMWAMGLNGNVGIGRLPPSRVQADAGKILQNLNWGLMARGEIRKGRWGLLADGLYADLGGSHGLGDNLYESGSLGISQGLASLALAYRVVDDRRGFLDVYAGARYNYLGMDLALNQSLPGINNLSANLTTAISSRVGQEVDGLLESFKTRAAPELAEAVASRVTPELLPGNGRRDLSADDVHLLNRLAGAGRSDRRSSNGRRSPGRDSTEPDDALSSALQSGRLGAALANARPAIREYIEAEAAARLAAAQGVLTDAITARVTAAQQRLTNAISRSLQQKLPTAERGSRAWIDPIIGLRAQINLTRWLFIAGQGDTGGFGAGSQMAWNTQATVGVNVTRNVFVEAGYRYMFVDYDRDGFLYQMNYAGAFAGLGFKF